MPIAVLLSDSDKLYKLARDKSPAARAELSKTIGSILEADVTPRESELVADVLIKLMRQAEKDIRQAVSEQISTLEGVPLRLVLQLANDDIEIARPVLTNSYVLGDFDLMYIIKSKTTEYWQAIAKREKMSEQVIDVLADTHDFDTALTLAENTKIQLTEHALVALSDIAQDNEELAVPLLRREEVESDLAAKIYKFVGEEIKSFIKDNYDIDENETDFVVDLVVDEANETKAPKDFMPDDYMISAAKKFKETHTLDEKLMLSALRRGHMRSFIAQFATFIDEPVETVMHLLSQADGRGLAIAAKANGIEKQGFISMFMLTSKIWNYGRLVDMGDIKTAIDYFHNVTPEEAQKIIANKEL